MVDEIASEDQEIERPFGAVVKDSIKVASPRPAAEMEIADVK